MSKKIISIVLAVLLTVALLPTSVLAAGTDANGDFTIDQNGVLTKYNGPGGHVAIPDGVKTVGTGVFYNCASLLSVTIPDSVTSIKSSAFRGCSTLTEITLPAGVTSIGSAAFQDCKNLSKINIPNGVTRIEGNTFVNCLSLKEIVLPAGVTRIGDNAFDQCTSLERINIPAGVTEIGSWAFYRCSALTRITLPDGLTGIGTKAFAGSGLTEIDIPGSVRTDGRYDSVCAFEGCTRLTKAVLREGIPAIPMNEFWNCSNLATVYIPKSVTEMGSVTDAGRYSYESGAFTGTGLTDVYYAGTQEEWNRIAIHSPVDMKGNIVNPFQTAALHYNSAAPAASSAPGVTPSTPETPSTALTAQSTDANGNTFTFTWDGPSGSWTLTGFTAVGSPKNITVPATVEGKPVKAIGSLALAAQAGIETVQLPDAVTRIGDRAFLNCWGLKTVNIPKSLTIIEYSAFENCKALQNVEFPTTLTTIETRAFLNCASLTRVDIPDSVVNFGSKTLTTENWGMTGRVFEGCTSLKDLSLGSGAADFWQAFMGTAVETAVVPRTVNDSLNAQGSIRPRQYQTNRMYQNCTSLKTAYVESGVSELILTFARCPSLEALYLPKTVTELYGVFDGIITDNPNHHLDIYYQGSPADFDKIKLTSGYCEGDALGKERTAGQKIAEINEKKPNGLTVTVHYNAYSPTIITGDTRAALSAANILHELGLFQGTGTNPDGTPNYALDKVPTRYEAVTMLVRLLGREDEAKSHAWDTPFTDVVDWAKPYVGYAYANGLTSGVSSTRFGGDDNASKAQYATFILRALGYSSSTDFRWDDPWGLLTETGVMLKDSLYWDNWMNPMVSSFYREDMALMSLLCLSAKCKGTNTSLIETVMDGSEPHVHSYRSFTVPPVGYYEKVPVERTKVYAIEYHCNGCGYITYDYNDMDYHQSLASDAGCGGGTTYPDPNMAIWQPWYSYTRCWTQEIPGVELRICTVCGKAA